MNATTLGIVKVFAGRRNIEMDTDVVRVNAFEKRYDLRWYKPAREKPDVEFVL